MDTHKRQLKHHKKIKPLIVGGVVIPAYNFWLGNSLIGGGLTMATQGEEANESPNENESGETSAPTSGSSAGGDASAGAAGSGAGGSM